MLSNELVLRLLRMPFRVDAVRRVSYLPLGSIYWTDELNETVDELFEPGPEADRDALLRLFRIRMRNWEGETVTEAEWRFFEEARVQVPGYALFRRLEISDEDLEMHRFAAKESVEFWTEFLGGAGEVRVVRGEG